MSFLIFLGMLTMISFLPRWLYMFHWFILVLLVVVITTVSLQCHDNRKASSVEAFVLGSCFSSSCVSRFLQSNSNYHQHRYHQHHQQPRKQKFPKQEESEPTTTMSLFGVSSSFSRIEQLQHQILRYRTPLYDIGLRRKQKTKLYTTTSTTTSVDINNNDHKKNDDKHQQQEQQITIQQNEVDRHQPNQKLTNNEILRYSRHLVLKDVGMIGQEKLKNANVLVIGAGGLGSPVLLYLAAAGIGHIGIVDNDLVSESNLQRQIIHSIHTIGISKCISAKQQLLNINPYIHVHIYETEFTTQTAIDIVSNGFPSTSCEELQQPNNNNHHHRHHQNRPWDVIVDGSDNFPTKYLINDVCAIYNIPWVYSAILGFEGQVSVFNYHTTSHTTSSRRNGPDYRDLLPIPPPPGDIPSCAEGGVIGVLPGTMGCLQATETIKLILYGKHNNNNESNNQQHSDNDNDNEHNDHIEILSGRVLVFDGLKMKFNELTLHRDNESRIPITSLLDDYVAFCNTPSSSTTTAKAATLLSSSLQAPTDILNEFTQEQQGEIAVRSPNQKGKRTMDEEENSDNDNISSSITSTTASKPNLYHSIAPKECLHKLIHTGWTPYVIDVRISTEHDIVSLPFTDTTIPYRTIQYTKHIPTNGDVLIYCKSGVRGKKACQLLIEQGIEPYRLYNLDGGIMRWQHDIDPSMPRY